MNLHFKISSKKKVLTVYFMICLPYNDKAVLGSKSATCILFLLSVAHTPGTNLCIDFRIPNLWDPQHRKMNEDNLQ